VLGKEWPGHGRLIGWLNVECELSQQGRSWNYVSGRGARTKAKSLWRGSGLHKVVLHKKIGGPSFQTRKNKNQKKKTEKKIRQKNEKRKNEIIGKEGEITWRPVRFSISFV